MDFTIIDALPAHIPHITRIYQQAVLQGTASFELDPPNEAEMLARYEAIIGKGYPYNVAVNAQGQLLAYAYASAYRSRPAYRWTVENSVYVDPARQGNGLGHALTAETVRRCEALGFRQMIAIVGGSDHKASIAMHEKLGFVHVGLLPATGFKHGKWLDSVVLQLALGEGDAADPDMDAYPATLYTKPSA
ncbi:MAG: N-acetyltransferase family protein [Pseudomonadota bacterium]